MEIDERGKKLKLWVRRKKTGLKLICSRCGQHVAAGRIHEVCEREVRDLPCFEYTTTVVVETYRVKCPRCGIRAEKVAQLPSKAPYSKRFEEAVGQACESAAARQVGRQMGDGREHGASHRSALSGAMGCQAAPDAAPTNGGGRNLSGQEGQVPHGGVQSGDGRATVVWEGAEEGDAG
jgi:ribosomal protein S27AE